MNPQVRSQGPHCKPLVRCQAPYGKPLLIRSLQCTLKIRTIWQPSASIQMSLHEIPTLPSGLLLLTSNSLNKSLVQASISLRGSTLLAKHSRCSFLLQGSQCKHLHRAEGVYCGPIVRYDGFYHRPVVRSKSSQQVNYSGRGGYIKVCLITFQPRRA